MDSSHRPQGQWMKYQVKEAMHDAHGVPHQVLGRVRPQQRGRGQQQEEQGQNRKKAAHVKYQDIGGSTQLFRYQKRNANVGVE